MTKVPAALRNLIATSIFLILVFLALYFGVSRWVAKGYEGKLPALLEVSETVEVGSSSGFMEGCGVAVFRLSKSTSKKILETGIEYFAEANKARELEGHEAFNTYGQWRQTPIVESSDNRRGYQGWRRGNLCGGLSSAVRESIRAAESRPGSFYAAKPEAILLVIPSLALAVFAHDG